MAYILGIDTGGTFTDAVIVDVTREEVVDKAKTLTTTAKLDTGITRCLRKLDPSALERVVLVNLSTTLATNAIVTGRRGRVGLLVIGKLPDGDFPADHIVVLNGMIDIKGREVENLDLKEITSAVEKLRSRGVDAVAISGFSSVRNPKHEIFVSDFIRETWAVPIVCAHDLSSSLGFKERTTTAVLNAGLIPTIDELIKAVKEAVTAAGVSARIMVVKGDGSLIGEDEAQRRPVDTILSGPAASVLGGMALSGLRDGVILDMGGTTTDIALVVNGEVDIEDSGATVGGHPTHVRAARIHTYGLGGDSLISVDRNGNLRIGPERVVPLCVAGDSHPDLLAELPRSLPSSEFELYSGQFFDCYRSSGRKYRGVLSDRQTALLDLLRDEPHSLFYLSHRIGADPEKLGVEDLLKYGVIDRMSLTPTDILHVTGDFIKWDKELPRMAVDFFAKHLGTTAEDLIGMVFTKITRSLLADIIESVSPVEVGEDIASFLDATIQASGSSSLSVRYSLDTPLVAVGAPVSSWIPPVAEKLDCDLSVPPHSEVANAYGAAVGKVCESARVLIRYSANDDNYLVYAPWDRVVFAELIDAVEYSTDEARAYVAEKIRRSGGINPEIVVKRKDHHVDGDFVETVITVGGIGSPEW